MADSRPIYLTKAGESLQGAESEFAQNRYDNAANRCYDACFRAAAVARYHTAIGPRGGLRGIRATPLGALIKTRTSWLVIVFADELLTTAA